MRWLILIAVAFATVLCLRLLGAAPTSAVERYSQPQTLKEIDANTIATAPQPPALVQAKLGGKPVYVLYVTRNSDTVIVRCYPTQSPTLVVKDMPGQPGVKEGTLTCKSE